MYSGLMKRHSLRFILLVHCTCTCRSMHLHKNIFPNLYQMIKLAIGKYLIKLISFSLLYDYSKINQILQSKNKKAFKLILEFFNSNPCQKKRFRMYMYLKPEDYSLISLLSAPIKGRSQCYRFIALR